MKKDKSEKIFNSLHEYLKKRNYDFQASSNIGLASEQASGIFSLMDSHSPNSYGFSATSANLLHVEHQFARLKSWMMEASEPCRSELSQLLFPLFVHIYLELGASNGKHAANAFFNRNYQVFRVNRDYEQTLRQLITTSATGDSNLPLIRSLRSGKYQVKLSDSNTLHYLLRYLKNSNNPTIVQILNRYIEIELDDGFVPSSVFSDLDKLSSTDDASGVGRSSCATSEDCSAEELASVDSVINNVRGLQHPGLSLALYTVVNAYNGICNATTSPNVEMLACAFEDSIIKIWSLTPHFPHSAGAGVGKSHTVLSCDDSRLDDPVMEEEKQAAGDGEEGATGYSQSSSASSPSSIRQRKQTTGGEVWTLRGHTGTVYDLAFTVDSTHLVSASEDTYMRLWDVTVGECVAKYTGHNYPVFRVECSPHNVHVATGSYDLSARLWGLEYLHPLRVFAGHTASVSSLAFHPNCSYLATGSWDNSVRLWQVTDANVARILLHHTAPVTSLAFAPHGKYLASGSEDGSVVLWDLAEGKVLADLSHLTTSDLPLLLPSTVSQPEGIVELSWSSDSKLLIVGSIDGTVRTIGVNPAQDESSNRSCGTANNSNGTAAGVLEGTEVHSVACGGSSTGGDVTLLHATLTRHNYIAAVLAQQPDR
uniref:TAF5-like RNA polymerase II p300/CBP-associated factor-associated factor 65 kDa subunit 5L n=2 Tax=Hirondellea gigas TaxID=1518452 RepID=A0A6A7FVJ6_9CRUS